MIALVTGASRGIGRSIAQTLAGEGYDLYLTCDRSYDELMAFARSLEETYPISARPYRTDMGDAAMVGRLFDDIDELDVLVNNAGISYIGLLQDMSDEDWHRVISVNLDSVFYTSREAASRMVRQGSGCIINISSVWGEHGASMEVAYSASKGGVNAFTRALAKELAPMHVRVNAIACGVIDTDMNSCFTRDELSSIIEDIPADRLGSPDEVASLVKMLITAPDYLTGQIITLDGGFT